MKMNKSISLMIGAATGVAVGIVINYLFGAASETTFDAQYQSRWDWALAEGRAAAATHEVEMRRRFEVAKQPKLPPPVNNA